MSTDIKLRLCPKLENLATTPITIKDIPFGKWVKIPTTENKAGHYGRIKYLPVIPGKNISVDLIYEGGIKCRDKSPYHHGDYNAANPVFNSENLRVVNQNRYRFETDLSESRSLSQTFGQAKSAIPSHIRKRYLNRNYVDIPFLKDINKTDRLEDVLERLYDHIYNSTSKAERYKGYFNFRLLLKEFLETGQVTGDCKAVSTFSCGLLNLVGLPARRIAGIIICGKGKKKRYSGHEWVEVYSNGFWTLFDAAGGFRSYPSPTTPLCYTYSTDLPRFSNHAIKEAKLRISYVKSQNT